MASPRPQRAGGRTGKRTWAVLLLGAGMAVQTTGLVWRYAGRARRGFHTLLAPRVPQRAVAEQRKTGFCGAGRDSAQHGAWRGEKPRDIVSSGGAQGSGRRLRPQCGGRGGPVYCFRVALSRGELCRWCRQAYSGPGTPSISSAQKFVCFLC